jgi:hypothetical protein
MRYCNNCHHITIGQPLFCNFCGSSYDVKLCPHRHLNPRIAQVCSQCGSHDLSTPAPRASFATVVLMGIVSIFPGIALLLITLLILLGLLQAILTNEQLQLQLLILALLLGVLWYIYIHLPPFIRRIPRTLWNKKKQDRHS